MLVAKVIPSLLNHVLHFLQDLPWQILRIKFVELHNALVGLRVAQQEQHLLPEVDLLVDVLEEHEDDVHDGEDDFGRSLCVDLYKLEIFFLNSPHFLQSELLITLNLLLFDIPQFLQLLKDCPVLLELARCLS